jgi:hypothetical protein
VFASDPAPRSVEQPPAGVPTSTVVPSETPAVSASPTPVAQPADTPLGAIWPLTTHGELEAWEAEPSRYPALATQSGSALAFARNYLLVSDATVVQDGKYWLVKRPGGVQVSALSLRGFGANGMAPFLVTSAATDAVTILSPEEGDSARSPLKVSGTYREVEPRINVRLRGDGTAAAPVEYGDRYAETGPPDVWSTEIAFTPTTRPGSVMVTIGSLRDEGIAAAAVIPLAFPAPTASPTDVALAVRSQRVVVLDANGRILRYLSGEEPGGGAYHPDLSPDGTRATWSQGAGTCAAAGMYAPVAGGEARQFAGGEDGVAAMPTWVGNDRIAYTLTTCTATGETTALWLYDVAKETHKALRALPEQPSALAASPDGKHLAWVVGTSAATYDLATGTTTNVAPTQECTWRGLDIVGTSSLGKPILIGVETCMHSTSVWVYRFAVGAPDHDGVAELKHDAAFYRIEFDAASGAFLVTHGVEDGASYIERVGRDGAKSVLAREVDDAGW